MECAGKARRSPCVGPPTRRCERCRAVAYCSLSHQVSHRSVHRKECGRLREQMNRVEVLNNFPFTFSNEATVEICEKRKSRCSFLTEQGVHGRGMWMWECSCGESTAAAMLDDSRLIRDWNLSSVFCPCKAPSSSIPEQLNSWNEYYEWRGISLCSPVAVLLHWPLMLYWTVQLATRRNLIPQTAEELCIHYLGPERELHQLVAFGELRALFPGVKMRLELIGPAIPKERDGEGIDLYGYARCTEMDCECKSTSETYSPRVSRGRSPTVRVQLHSGFYHDRYRDIVKDSYPNLIISPNAGLAAYTSWLPTIDLIKAMKVPAIFSDYCEEASHLAASCISTVTGCSPTIPIQLNPFRQPMAVEDSALLLPCYSNCFVFGMSSSRSEADRIHCIN